LRHSVHTLDGVKALYIIAYGSCSCISLNQQTAYDIMTMPLTTTHHSEVQLSQLLPKNWMVRSPPYFTQGMCTFTILGMTPKP